MLLFHIIGGAIIAASISLSTIPSSPFINVIKHYEGFYAKPYKCPAGVWTIGYGHTRGVTADSPAVDEREAHALLLEDLAYAGKQVLRLAGDALKDSPNDDVAAHRFMALVSWTFNLGEGNLATSTMLRRIKEGRWDEAAQEMLRWDKARVKGKLTSLPGLTKRRQCEAHYFRTGCIAVF